MSSLDDKAGDLSDYAIGHPNGFTADRACADLGWEYPDFIRVVRRVREIFSGDTDEWTLICEPQGQNEQWRYRWTRGYEEAKFWLANRTGDTDSRLNTMLMVARTTMSAEDGRSISGRKARKRVKMFSRLIEDLAEIDDEAANGG